jgi:hypothetical protein
VDIFSSLRLFDQQGLCHAVGIDRTEHVRRVIVCLACNLPDFSTGWQSKPIFLLFGAEAADPSKRNRASS